MRLGGVIQIAAMLAALLLSAGLVLRISATLSPIAPETRDDTAVKKALVLRNGVSGQTLFEGENIAPGQTVERCISVRATGTRSPDAITMFAESRIDDGLADWLELGITRGPDIGDGSDCTDFTGTTEVLRGSAEDVMAALERGVDWTPTTDEVIPSGHAATFRVEARLLEGSPNSIQGESLAFDVEWRSPYAAAGETIFSRTFAVMIRFTEDSMLPMLLILALAILFLGIQDRLDTATPRLSKAVLFDDLVVFEDRAPATSMDPRGSAAFEDA